MPLNLSIVTAEREVFADAVDSVVAPGWDGEVGILPHHAALMTALQAGEIRIRRGGQEDILAVSGGFMEVRNDQVTILADSAERAEEIDLARAEEARRRAQERLAMRTTTTDVDAARAEAAFRRATLRLRIGQRRRRSGPGGSAPGTTP